MEISWGSASGPKGLPDLPRGLSDLVALLHFRTSAFIYRVLTKERIASIRVLVAPDHEGLIVVTQGRDKDLSLI